MTRLALLAVALVLGAAAPAWPHHVGVYTPQDNEVSANLKRIKYAIQARKFDVALRLFETGALRKEMRAQADRLPAGLEPATRAALTAGDAARSERGLMIFFAAAIRDLALEADRRLAERSGTAEARAAAAQKFLDAIWRYYNLIDFAVGQQDPKAAVAVRLAFDEAAGYAQGSTATAPGAPAPESRPAAPGPAGTPDPDKVREPLQRIARTLSGLIETSSTAMR